MNSKNTIPTWQEIKTLARWTPIHQLAIPMIKTGDGIYKVAQNMFISTGDYDRELRKREDGPFLGSVLWAATDGAAKRVRNFDIEADSDESAIVPPNEMLCDCKSQTYVEIRDLLNSGKYGKYREGSTFRLDGKRVANYIEIKPWTFYFRGVADNGQTLPFAIEYILPGEEFIYAGMNLSPK